MLGATIRDIDRAPLGWADQTVGSAHPTKWSGPWRRQVTNDPVETIVRTITYLIGQGNALASMVEVVVTTDGDDRAETIARTITSPN